MVHVKGYVCSRGRHEGAGALSLGGRRAAGDDGAGGGGLGGGRVQQHGGGERQWRGEEVASVAVDCRVSDQVPGAGRQTGASAEVVRLVSDPRIEARTLIERRVRVLPDRERPHLTGRSGSLIGRASSRLPAGTAGAGTGEWVRRTTLACVWGHGHLQPAWPIPRPPLLGRDTPLRLAAGGQRREERLTSRRRNRFLAAGDWSGPARRGRTGWI